MFAGIDIGSRTIGLVVMSGGGVKKTGLEDTGFQPLDKAKKMLTQTTGRIFATGYGRHAAMSSFAHGAITEIKAHAMGSHHFLPGVRTVLDMGGQDTKVILLDGNGSVKDFQMNDRCSAGTGKFLEIMSLALGFPAVAEFGNAALDGRPGIKISNMCTVFAESEAVSLLHKGVAIKDISLALHAAVVERTAGMLQRVGFEPPLVFTGGVANNRCIIELLETRLGVKVMVPKEPQLVGALGAALAAGANAPAC
ncbi:MAG: acyl-CoA dehydratase activase [Firmicutes bacterium]|nr:acyl-CoA dehydratase activase [Bacillota bacterium]